MSAQLLDGKQLAKKIKDELKTEVSSLQAQYNDVPKMVNLLIGKDDGSCAYANSQKRVAEYIGINYELKMLDQDISQEMLASTIKSYNQDSSVHGIMLHKPVPKHIDYHSIANYVDTIKDLEGINVANIGKMILGETKIIPCTPASVMEHIKSTGISLRGKEVVIVGKPLSILLLEEMATVTVCHIATSEAGTLESHVKRADVVVVAVGRASVIPGNWIKEGAIVVDVGINTVNGNIVGDVEFDKAKARASYITPVPGGVGPVTVVMLMRNGLEAFKAQTIKESEVNT